MKIGILTFHHSNYNYGAVLQAFSIYKLIESLGYESYIINYTPEPPTCRKKLAAFVIALLGREFHKFRKKNIPRILPKTTEFAELKTLNCQLDGFVVGSDQVWRYREDLQALYRYYLDFVDDHKPKIAYAASFGVDYWEADEQVTRKIKTLINRFQAISVREKSGIKICNNIFGVKASNVLDPTLLLNPTFFHELADKNTARNLKNKKMVYMMLDDTPDKESFFRQVAKSHELKFDRINGKKLVPKKGFFLWKSVNSWLNSIKYSELVVTDSFHCTVFSILFKKKFICIANKHKGVTRLQNLLKLAQLESRLIFDFHKMDETLLKSEINYQNVEYLLLKEKTQSINFLKSSLEQLKTK